MATWTKLPRHIYPGGQPSKWEVNISYDHPIFPGCYGHTEHDTQGEGGGLWFEPTTDGRFELTDYDGVYTLSMTIIKTLKAAGFKVPEEFFPEPLPKKDR